MGYIPIIIKQNWKIKFRKNISNSSVSLLQYITKMAFLLQMHLASLAISSLAGLKNRFKSHQNRKRSSVVCFPYSEHDFYLQMITFDESEYDIICNARKYFFSS